MHTMYEQSMNHISLIKIRPRCYVKSPTVPDTFRPIPGLISCTGGDQDMGTYEQWVNHAYLQTIKGIGFVVRIHYVGLGENTNPHSLLTNIPVLISYVKATGI